MRRNEARAALVDGAVLQSLERSLDAPGGAARHVILAGLDPLHVHLDLAGSEAIVRATPRHVHRVGARDQRLGRRAAGVDAGAAEAAALDDGDPLACACQPSGEGRPRLSGANDDRIIVGHAVLPGLDDAFRLEHDRATRGAPPQPALV